MTREEYFKNCFEIMLGTYTLPLEVQWEVADQLFFTKMMKKKFEYFNIDIDIDPTVYILLAFITDRPGLFQLILYNVIYKAKTKHITVAEFAAAYDEFPYLDDPSELEKMEEEYDKVIKREPCNLCDIDDFWIEAINHNLPEKEKI